MILWSPIWFPERVPLRLKNTAAFFCFWKADLLDVEVFNLTAAIYRLYAVWPLVPGSLSVFKKEGFSPCLKRLMPLHLGCQGCLNFSKLSPALFSQHRQKKSNYKNICAFFFSRSLSSPPRLPPLSSIHIGLEDMRDRFNKDQIPSLLLFLASSLSAL